jgi:hypothetical protein
MRSAGERSPRNDTARRRWRNACIRWRERLPNSGLQASCFRRLQLGGLERAITLTGRRQASRIAVAEAFAGGTVRRVDYTAMRNQQVDDLDAARGSRKSSTVSISYSEQKSGSHWRFQIKDGFLNGPELEFRARRSPCDAGPRRGCNNDLWQKRRLQSKIPA